MAIRIIESRILMKMDPLIFGWVEEKQEREVQEKPDWRQVFL